MTAQEKDRIECAIRHIQTAVDVDPWAVEIAVEAMKTQLSAEGTTSDLISRQDAIEVIEEMQMPIMRSMFPEEQFVFKGMSEALSAIKDLPSAHSEIEERKEESAQNVPKEDLISRKAAIDALDCINGTEEVLRSLPSAQPEPCKDAVSREAAIDVAENAFVRGLLASPDIRRLPSAQPEIIHCKDCKHFGVDRYKKLTWCSRINYGYGYQADDFCSKAERRTDE